MKKNKRKEDNKKKIIIVITIVTLIIALVAGGTYAYWTWVSANNTAVNIKVDSPTMTLDGGGTLTVTNLVPTSCTNTTYAVQRTIKYSVTNPTSVDATATIQLKPTTFPTQLKNAKLMWKLTTGANCTGSEVASGNFGSTVLGTVMDLTTKVGSVKSGTTYYVPAKTTTALTGTYYLSIWLDSTYTGTANTGSTVKDTIQNKSMTLQLTGTIAQNPS